MQTQTRNLFSFVSCYPLETRWSDFWRYVDAGKRAVAVVLLLGKYRSSFANLAPVLTQTFPS